LDYYRKDRIAFCFPILRQYAPPATRPVQISAQIVCCL